MITNLARDISPATLNCPAPNRFVITPSGGPRAMEVANRGTHEGSGKTLGLTANHLERQDHPAPPSSEQRSARELRARKAERPCLNASRDIFSCKILIQEAWGPVTVSPCLSLRKY
jgi:hypothetical protein